MRTLTPSDRSYPCFHGVAKFGNVDADTVITRRCGTCGIRYAIHFVRATDHAQEVTGQTLWRACWRVA